MGIESGLKVRSEFELRLVINGQSVHCCLGLSALEQDRVNRWLGVSFLELIIGGRDNS